MSAIRHISQSPYVAVTVTTAALVWLTACRGEEPFQIDSVEWNADSEVEVTFDTTPGAYYVLYQGAHPLKIHNPVDLHWPGDTGAETRPLKHVSPSGDMGFYKVKRLPFAPGNDTDGDGLDDFDELQDPLSDPLLSALEGVEVLTDRTRFDLFARRDNVPGALAVKEVKFLITDVPTDNPGIYFLNTNIHPYHHCFARDALRQGIDLQTFNSQTYFREEGRQFIAGSLIAHENFEQEDGETTTIYTVEFWPTDPVGFTYIRTAFELIRARMPFAADRIFYHPNGGTQETLFEREKDLYAAHPELRTISSRNLFGNFSYSALNMGTSFGLLKVAEAGTTYSARDIVIFRSIPNDLSITGGIITEVPQTPLSHVNLKAQQNRIPNAYIKNASTESPIDDLIGSYVRFEAEADGFTLEAATQEEVEEYLEAIRPTSGPEPTRNLTETTIRPLSEISFNDATAYGVKAANVAELRRVLPPEMVPDGFGIPFSYYHEFMEHNGFYDEARAMISTEAFESSPEHRAEALKAFRKKIRAGDVPDTTMTALDEMKAGFPPDTTLRFRSSTNNEDLEDFNGAGLYNSYTHHLDEGHLSKSARQVWASLWTYRAFEERDFYRIDHFKVAMGILVHPNFEEEQANGVGITRNIFDPRWPGFYINVQVGEDLVTNPEEESVPEELLVSYILAHDNWPYYEYELQYARYSNRVAADETVLTRDQAIDLADRMWEVQIHFQNLYDEMDNPDFAVDLEFKITKEGQLVIKQARPWTWPGWPEAENDGC
ncbi:MAG: PEP/pyruvate-binding domain-containing protein [Verrucomicrobiota bacterium]